MAIKRSYRERRELGSFCDHFGPERFVEEDSSVFLCQSRQVGLALSIRGPDYVCVDEEDLASITSRWSDAIRMFTPGFEIRQYAIKTSNPRIPRGNYGHPEVERLAGGRADQVTSAGADLYAVEQVALILLDCPGRGGSKPSILAENLHAGCTRLRNAVASFVQHIKSDITVSVLDKDGTYNFFRKLVNFASDKLGPRSRPSDESLAFAACESRLRSIKEDENHRDPYLWIEHLYAKLMTLKIHPKKTDENMLAALYAVPCDFILASSWRPEDVSKTERTARFRMGRLRSASKQAGTNPNDKPFYDEDGMSKAEQLNAMLDDIGQNGERFGHYSLYALLHGDETRVQASVVEISKVFQSNKRDGVFHADHEHQLGGYLSMLPGNGQRDYRKQRLSLSNYADLSTIFSVDCGNVRNTHLDAEYWTVFETKPPQGLFGRSAYFWNPLVGESMNLVVDGAPGSGKTIFLKTIAANAQKYKPYTVFLDLKHSFRGLVKRFGGAVISFADPAYQGNPLLLPETEENIRFLSLFVGVLIERGGGSMTTEDKEGLHNYIRIMYRQPVQTRRLHALRHMLRLDLADSLAPWVEGGQYGHFFDSPVDHMEMTGSDMISLEFEGMNAYKEVMEPLLFCAIHKMRNAVFDPDQLFRLKLLFIDEAWDLIKHKVILGVAEEAARTYRDKNGCIIICTQGLGDLPKWFMDYCPSLAIFRHNRLDKEIYKQVLNPEAIKELEKLRTHGEFIWTTPNGSTVLQYNASDEELLAYKE